MVDDKEAFVGIDVAKLRSAVAIADAGGQVEVRFFGEVDVSATNMRRVIGRIASRFGRVRCCAQAGQTGDGLHRPIRSLAHQCTRFVFTRSPRFLGISDGTTAGTPFLSRGYHASASSRVCGFPMKFTKRCATSFAPDRQRLRRCGSIGSR